MTANEFAYGGRDWGSDAHIRAMLAECEGDTYAVAESLCDREVYNRDYEGCSVDLELAFHEYETRAQRIKEAS